MVMQTERMVKEDAAEREKERASREALEKEKITSERDSFEMIKREKIAHQ